MWDGRLAVCFPLQRRLDLRDLVRENELRRHGEDPQIAHAKDTIFGSLECSSACVVGGRSIQVTVGSRGKVYSRYRLAGYNRGIVRSLWGKTTTRVDDGVWKRGCGSWQRLPRVPVGADNANGVIALSRRPFFRPEGACIPQCQVNSRALLYTVPVMLPQKRRLRAAKTWKDTTSFSTSAKTLGDHAGMKRKPGGTVFIPTTDLHAVARKRESENRSCVLQFIDLQIPMSKCLHRIQKSEWVRPNAAISATQRNKHHHRYLSVEDPKKAAKNQTP